MQAIGECFQNAAKEGEYFEIGEVSGETKSGLVGGGDPGGGWCWC